MIEALVSGKLHGQPVQKIARTGKPFVVARCVPMPVTPMCS